MLTVSNNYMATNREISRLFNLYAELLMLHQKDAKLSALLSGASYRIRNMDEEVTVIATVTACRNSFGRRS